MASFNLGKIKGERGEAGPKGDIGPKGEKGEKGECGANGATPIFSVAEVKTLASSENAYVKINNDSPQSPKLSFGIPCGKAGKDAAGDMLGAMYDTEKKEQDIFKYADTLFENALKKSGGVMLGEIQASVSDTAKNCVRNISISENLPQDGKNGDICILLRPKSFKTIGDSNAGDIILIPEDGEETEYIVGGKDNLVTGGVTLLRKYLPEQQIFYDYSMRNNYLLSDADILLETIYKYFYPKSLREKMLFANLDSNIKRQCFLLSHTEIDEMEYFKENKRNTSVSAHSGSAGYLTRSLSGTNTAFIVGKDGLYSTVPLNNLNYFRPAIVVPKELEVLNVTYNQSPALSLAETKEGVYAMKNGEWEECASWQR